MKSKYLFIGLVFIASFLYPLCAHAEVSIESEASEEEEETGTVIIHLSPIEDISVTLNIENSKGETIPLTLNDKGTTAAELPVDTYRIQREIDVAFSPEYENLEDKELKFSPKIPSLPSCVFTVEAGRETEIGSATEPMEIWFTFDSSQGVIHEKVYSANLLSYDARLEPPVSEEQKLLEETYDPAKDKEYQESMAAYIDEICRKENIDKPDDSKIAENGAYGDDPYGVKAYDAARRDLDSEYYQETEAAMTQVNEKYFEESEAEESSVDETKTDETQEPLPEQNSLVDFIKVAAVFILTAIVSCFIVCILTRKNKR